MKEFVGMSVVEVIAELEAKGYDYEVFRDCEEEVISIDYNPDGKPFDYYADGNIELEIEDGYCVGFDCEDWD